MQYLISIAATRMEWCKRSKETGRARYIILLKVKRVCRLDQNMVTMALRRVFYSLSLSTLTHAGFYINQFKYCAC